MIIVVCAEVDDDITGPFNLEEIVPCTAVQGLRAGIVGQDPVIPFTPTVNARTGGDDNVVTDAAKDGIDAHDLPKVNPVIAGTSVNKIVAATVNLVVATSTKNQIMPVVRC